MEDEEIIEWGNSHPSTYCYFKNSEEYKAILSKTKFLDEIYENVVFMQRIWHIKNKIYNTVKCEICGKPVKYIGRKEKAYNSTCSRSCLKIYENTIKLEKRDKTCIEKYGTNNVNLLPEIKEKSKQTCIRKYGVDHSSKIEKAKEKAKNTNIERYGVESYSKTEEFKEKAKNTNIERYGAESYSKTEEFKEKIRISGVDYNKIQEKIKQTSLDRYGVESYSKTEEFKEKSKQTYLNHYGVESYSKTEEFKKRVKESSIKYYFDKFNKILRNDGFLDKGYVLAEEFIDKSYKILCPHCNKEFIIDKDSVYYFRKTNNQEICTLCNPLCKSFSSQEKELLDFIKSIYDGEITENSRSIINPYELDIYIPEKQIAIEFNGLYWHSEKFIDKDYHKMKSDLCKEKGIHLIHVFEDEWLYKQEIVKSVIKNFLGYGHQKIYYARKLIVKDVPSKETQEFLENNHMLGRMMSMSHSIGLYDKETNELLSLMAFRCISKDTNTCELTRYAIKRDINIKGGAERIFSNFLKMYGHLYKKCVTFNDNGVFKGTVHYRLGFTHTGNNPPNYMYYDRNIKKRVSKQSLRKVRLSYKKDEQQFIDENRYFRVYNAGNDTCEYIIEKMAK